MKTEHLMENEVIDLVLEFASEKTLWENAMMYRNLEKTPEKMDNKPYDYFKGLDLKQYVNLTQDEIRERYETVFNTYTTPKKRVYSGKGTCFDFPATYQGLTHEDIVEVIMVSDSRVEVICKILTGFKRTIKFIAMKKQGKWLLDSVKSYSKCDDKWSSSLL